MPLSCNFGGVENMTPPTENLMNSELTLLYNTPTVLYCTCKVLHNTDVEGF